MSGNRVLKKADFDGCLNDRFIVFTEAWGELELELVEITEHQREKLECFSLIFKGPKEKLFHQKLYTLTHPNLGEFILFLVPISYGKQDAIYYQAVFNRILEGD
jgi:hypothetical protein